ncbi:hypothetical protein P175DRAFT_0470519 [Aspergillus ochraceoroseus IBT 24754]|uniref:ABM domain-containing protein n=1 Tax=Aspergillus ochraceoroseus IBT 24754 TaxID=1392256 RepID=A0A2T5M7D2_9EURO|nr:uncharacterized protein P175DRAFT_0470519 [Aspergillus ochraceoroseus IBT 24754]PTU24448.1 hypothetical protein P175DRAFT_0470519 [Aspergillus ochraceoroseus IBT 24754]
MSTVTEFIYFHLKDTVKPEDPSNNEGLALLRIFKATTAQSGYKGSAWGRTKEDENLVVWAIDWVDAHTGTQTSQLSPFLEPNTQIGTIFTTLQPPPRSRSSTLIANPVTELCPLAFPTSLSPQERTGVCDGLIRFRSALVERAAAEYRPKSFSMGQVERPGTFAQEKSPSGEAFVHLLVIGWESVEAHVAAKGTKEFTEAIQPIREKMVSPLQGLGMKHVTFQKV